MIQVPAVGVAEHLQRGELVSLLEDWQAPAMPVSLLYPHRRHLPRRVRVFMDWLEATLAPYLSPIG